MKQFLLFVLLLPKLLQKLVPHTFHATKPSAKYQADAKASHTLLQNGKKEQSYHYLHCEPDNTVLLVHNHVLLTIHPVPEQPSCIPVPLFQLATLLFHTMHLCHKSSLLSSSPPGANPIQCSQLPHPVV